MNMADKYDVKPEQVLADLKAGNILLVDVREPAEFANERIHGALLHPLSTFEPKALPTDGHRQIDLKNVCVATDEVTTLAENCLTGCGQILAYTCLIWAC